MILPSSSIFVSRSSLWSDLVRFIFSLAASSFWQKALSWTSSACSACRSATILSIASLTFAKSSSSTETARVESLAFCPPTAPFAPGPPRWRQAAIRSSSSSSASSAARRRTAAAPERRARASARVPLPERSWRSATDLDSCSRASSSVRTAMASATALVSSLRSALRLSHWLSRSWQLSRSFWRYSTSSERWAVVRVRSSFASESALVFSACSFSMASKDSVPLAI
mmetsp:Transcript_114608/g.311221  ORF Transcript_114608/g.311221 Transcript_114608/m.311221 type:complete len:227 (-) Transcript_114608:116-796(-)